MNKAIGLIEFKTVSAGVTATDIMVKTASVEMLFAQTVCPGKFVAIIAGSISAVKSAVEAAKNVRADEYIDSMVLGAPHQGIFPAIYGSVELDKPKALGIVETYDVAAIIVAADNAAKAADVTLFDIRLAKGMCGKSYVMFTGEVAAVSAAVENAKLSIKNGGMYLDSTVIANPDKAVFDAII